MTLKKRILTFFCSLLLCFNIMFGFNVQKANAIVGADDAFYVAFLLTLGTYTTYELQTNREVVMDCAKELYKNSFATTGLTGVITKKGKEIKEDLVKLKNYYASKSSFTNSFSTENFNANDYIKDTSAYFPVLDATFNVEQDPENDYLWYVTLNGQKIKIGETVTFKNGKTYTFNYMGSYDSVYIKFRSCYTKEQTQKPFFTVTLYNDKEVRLKLNYLLYLNQDFKSSTFIGNMQNLMSSTVAKEDTKDIEKALTKALNNVDSKFNADTTYTIKVPSDTDYSEATKVNYNAITNTYTYTKEAEAVDTTVTDGKVAVLEGQMEDVNTNVSMLSVAMQTLDANVKSIEQSLTDYLSSALGLIGNILDYVIDLPSNIFNSLKGAFNSVIDGVRDMLNWFTAPATISFDFTALQNIELAKKFPFSLPLDIKNAVSTFSAEPKTPNFTVQFPECFYNYKFTVDLKDFNFIASISRAFCIIIFNIALIYVTYKFMF